MGSKAVEAIIRERKENGHFKSIFDMAKRIDLRAASKKAFDGLAISGGFDSFGGVNRSQYYAEDEKGLNILEKAVRFGNKYQENKNSAQISLFGETSNVQFDEPIIPPCEEWNIMERLSKEKLAIGMYISGHPLDDYKTEMTHFCNADLRPLNNLDDLIGKELTFGGIISGVQHRISKNGKGWASFFMEDYHESQEFRIFGEDYLKFKHFLIPNAFLHVKISVRQGWNDGPARMSFSSIQMLQDILSKMAKKLTIYIDIDTLTKDVIDRLDDLTVRHSGNHALRFLVFDIEKKLKINMPSRTRKIHISTEYLKEMDENGFKYKIN